MPQSSSVTMDESPKGSVPKNSHLLNENNTSISCLQGPK